MAILETWKKSLQYFEPQRAVLFLRSVWNFYRYAIGLVIQNFWWLILGEISICFYLRDLLSRNIAQLVGSSITMDVSSSLLLTVMALLWFVIHAIFFVSMYTRSSDGRSLVFYYSLIRYVQLSLCFSLLVFFLIFLFQMMGILFVPVLPFSFVMLLRYLGYMIMFFWFESPWSLYGVARSVERGANVFFYNLPFFIVVFCCSLVVQLAFSYIFSFLIQDLPLYMFSAKYGKFIFECFVLVVMFVFFNSVRRIHYTDHYFS